jgi:DNA-binding XRE family transcriptional regulator
MELAEIRRHYHDILEHKYPDNAGGVFTRLNIIRALERELKTEFFDTDDFRAKMDAYLSSGGKRQRLSDGARLRKLRKKNGWTQDKLADRLQCDKRTIIRWEKNLDRISRKAKIWLEKAEGGELENQPSGGKVTNPDSLAFGA